MGALKIGMPRLITPLVFDSVSYWRGSRVAVNDVSAIVEPGITGLLGPNGAGKSTLLHLAAGLIRPSSGQIKVLGESPVARPAVFSKLGIVPEGGGLPERLTARAFIEIRATLLGMVNAREAASTALEMVGLDDVADRIIGGFSRGMTQRVKLAAAMVHEPEVLLLDEPFNGLDPHQRARVMQLLHHRAALGCTILLSSHVLGEIEDAASHVLVMVGGRLAASGDHRTLRRLMTDRPHTIRIRASDLRVLAAALLAAPEVTGVEVRGVWLEVHTRELAAFGYSLVEAAQLQGITLHEVLPADDSLERVYSYLVGR